MAFQKFKRVFLSIANDIPQDMRDIIAKLKDTIRAVNVLQNNVSATLDPITSLIQNDSIIVPNVALYANQLNIVNHTLGRPLVGWYVIRNRGCSLIWDGQDNNLSPNLTLWLYSKEMSSVDLLVF